MIELISRYAGARRGLVGVRVVTVADHGNIAALAMLNLFDFATTPALVDPSGFSLMNVRFGRGMHEGYDVLADALERAQRRSARIGAMDHRAAYARRIVTSVFLAHRRRGHR